MVNEEASECGYLLDVENDFPIRKRDLVKEELRKTSSRLLKIVFQERFDQEKRLIQRRIDYLPEIPGIIIGYHNKCPPSYGGCFYFPGQRLGDEPTYTQFVRPFTFRFPITELIMNNLLNRERNYEKKFIDLFNKFKNTEGLSWQFQGMSEDYESCTLNQEILLYRKTKDPTK